MGRARITRSARRDLARILAWSEDRFGSDAARRYEMLPGAAITDIATEPTRLGAKDRPELGAGVQSWHLRLSRERVTPPHVHKPRHTIFYVVDQDTVIILRVLHDSMAVDQHLDPTDTQ